MKNIDVKNLTWFRRMCNHLEDTGDFPNIVSIDNIIDKQIVSVINANTPGDLSTKKPEIIAMIISMVMDMEREQKFFGAIKVARDLMITKANKVEIDTTPDLTLPDMTIQAKYLTSTIYQWDEGFLNGYIQGATGCTLADTIALWQKLPTMTVDQTIKHLERLWIRYHKEV